MKSNLYTKRPLPPSPKWIHMQKQEGPPETDRGVFSSPCNNGLTQGTFREKKSPNKEISAWFNHFENEPIPVGWIVEIVFFFLEKTLWVLLLWLYSSYVCMWHNCLAPSCSPSLGSYHVGVRATCRWRKRGRRSAKGKKLGNERGEGGYGLTATTCIHCTLDAAG